MEIEEALTTYLLAQTGLTALIDRRFYFDILPQNCNLPAVVCTLISDVKDHTMTLQCDLERPMYQFSAYATTRAGARAVANQLKTALVDYHGTLSGIVVQYIRLAYEISTTETDADTKTSVTHLEYEVNFIKE